MDGVAAVREVIDRETRAWGTQDVELLLSIFHPDMVWAWPPSHTAVDPIEWQLVMGRFMPSVGGGDTRSSSVGMSSRTIAGR